MSADAGMTDGLAIRGVTVRFGGHLALHEVSVTAPPARVTGLIGPNGAGKTTLFNVATGMLSPQTGDIKLDGRALTKLPAYKRARLGLGRTFQRLELFTTLSVRENVAVAGVVAKRRQVRITVDEVMERVGVAQLADRDVGEIPTGMARRVELARALMTAPTMLLLDEPASGQNEDETAEFAALLTSLAADGTGILLVEHDMALVMAACTYLHVLDFGQIIAAGAPDEIRRDPAVIAAYLGAEATA